MTNHRTCSVDGCDRDAEKRGWCSMHYKRWRRNSNPLEGANGTKLLVESRAIDITGLRFGRLIALGINEKRTWTCQCDCGNRHAASAGNLRSGGVLSCGCLVQHSRRKSFICEIHPELNGMRRASDGRCIGCDKDQKRDYYQRTREARLAKQKTPEHRAMINEWQNARRRKNIHVRLRHAFGARILHALRGRGSKSARTVQLIGCSIEFLMGYLEAMFLPGMTCKNHAIDGWHIDHKIPCVRFDLSDPEQQKVCFHYTNLQPLWAEDNLRKQDKLEVM